MSKKNNKPVSISSGTRIEGKFVNPEGAGYKWYTGAIIRVAKKGEKYGIRFDDGSVERGFEHKDVRIFGGHTPKVVSRKELANARKASALRKTTKAKAKAKATPAPKKTAVTKKAAPKKRGRKDKECKTEAKKKKSSKQVGARNP